MPVNKFIYLDDYFKLFVDYYTFFITPNTLVAIIIGLNTPFLDPYSLSLYHISTVILEIWLK